MKKLFGILCCLLGSACAKEVYDVNESQNTTVTDNKLRQVESNSLLSTQALESAPSKQNHYTSSPTSPSYYIANNNYTQQAFASMFYMSSFREESSVSQHNDFLAHTFEDGAWNFYANVGYMYSALPSSGWAAGGGYSGLLWGQTGRSAGFALGGSFLVANLGTSSLNPLSSANQIIIPSNNLGTLSQAYIDYQYQDKLDVLGGNIIVTNPFMQTDVAYPTSVSVAPNTYTGLQAQWQPTRDMTFTLLRTFYFKPIDANGFSQTTNYERSFQYNAEASIFTNLNQATSGALAAGAQFNPNSASQTDVWLYQFYDYVNLGYVDTNYNWQASKLIGISMALQGAIEQANGANIIGQQSVNSPAYIAGSPQSNVAGAKLGVNISNWGVTAAYNNFWGTGYGNGGFVSPYTVYNVTDPFYTSSLLSGMVERGSAGSAYKLAANTNFLNSTLLFTGSYAKYLTAAVSNYPDTAEFDFTAQYVMPNFHGALVFTTEFSYLQQPAMLGGDLYSPVLWVSYAY